MLLNFAYISNSFISIKYTLTINPFSINMQTFSRVLVVAFAVAVLLAGCSSTKEIETPDVLTLEYLKTLPHDVLKTMDSDDDEINDYDEIFVYETNPLDPDTDGDGINDFDEIFTYGTDPLIADTDDDGLSDYEEVFVYGTDPLVADTDGDGLSDFDEINKYRTNPLETDTDGDGQNDYDEIYVHGTDANNPDTDGDGFTDGQEIEMGTDPLDNNDPAVILELTTVNFDFDKSNIDNNAARELAENVEKLKNAPNYTFRVEAFTDHLGGDQYNLRLSVRRANAVADFYRSNGISADRMTVAGLGKDPNPCAQWDANGKGCRENRRATTIPVNPYRYTPNLDR